MLKEYVAAEAGVTPEEFVAGFWDERWSRDDGVTPTDLDHLRRREEFRFLLGVVSGFEEGAGLDVLDCGCGRGEWTLLFRSMGHRAIGVDIAPQVVTRLKERHGESFRQGDFRRLAMPDGAFDLIINWGGIEHFEEGPAPSIQEARRLLRPGGWFVASTPCHNPRLMLLERVGLVASGAADALEKSRFYQYRFTPRELGAAMEACGLRDVRTRIIGGVQGLDRALQHELRWIERWLPGRLTALAVRLAAPVLRPLVGHMVVAAGMRPAGA